MDLSTMLKTVLFLHNNLLFIVDTKNKKVNDVYKGSNLITKSTSYDGICDIISETFDLQDTFKFILTKFLTNLEPQDEPFNLTVNYTKTDGTQTAILYKGLKLNENCILFTLSDSQTSTQTSFDDLTKCDIKEKVENEARKAIVDKEDFLLMLIDLDNFKIINETYGHMFGDMILIETAAAIRDFLKNRGFVARIGGDEFMVFLRIEDDYDTIHAACTELRTRISKLNGRNIKNAQLSATIGCASFPKDADNYELLYKKAESALLRGKNKGRNCFVIYTEERCGVVTLDTVIQNSIRKMDKSVTALNNYNVISGIIELLNRKSNLKINIYDSLSLIGNYLMLDRISLCVLNPDNEQIEYTLEWKNPLIKVPTIIFKASNINLWREVYDKSNMVKINQVSSNKHLPIYPLLESQKTSAIVAFELEHEGKIFGQIRYDMCSKNRFWEATNIGALMLLSKTFAIKINSEYLNKKHYNELYIDKLTGIRNYSRWIIDINEDHALSGEPEPYSIIFLKILDFYSLPTVVGYEECDKLLKRIAEWANKNNKGEIFCRASGDLFAVYSKLSDEKIIKEKFNELYEFIINNKNSKLTNVSVRAGAYIAEGYENIEDAIEKASLARDTKLTDDDFVLYTDKLYQEMMEQKTLELHIEDALKNNEFLLFIQPKISTKTKKIVCAEALTRWNYNFQRIIPPFKFIPLFERTGYITQLDYIVFENVCKFLRDIIDKGETPVPISVNVSRYTKDYLEYINTINSIREKYNIDSSLIELEITEGMYTENVDDIKNFVNLLREQGYTISIDDFGSGYSNLNNISKLKFEVLKLDKSLCSLIDDSGIIILDAIISTAKKSGHTIVCEGVETEKEYEILSSLGADLIQGYYFDKPLEKDEFRNKYIN